MEYRFFDVTDEMLIETSELPCEDGIAVALRATGRNAETDEVVEIAITDLTGAVLFEKRVKPQNVETWLASDVSGGLSPADVEDADELYQFETEISELFEKAPVVVAQHMPHTEAMIERGWITLPDFNGFDVIERFRLSHCTTDYPSEPATTASLESIAAYYGIACSTDTPASEAAAVAACYKALVAEHAREREAKGTAYWEARDARLAVENADATRAAAVARMREHRLNQMNGLLWFTGAIIFTSVAINVYQNGPDFGFMIICIAAATFCVSRGIVNFRK